MGIFDYIFKKNVSEKQNPGKLFSYRQAAELMCMCWNKLDMSFIKPYLDDNMTWKGGFPNRVVNGKENYLIDHYFIFNHELRLCWTSNTTIINFDINENIEETIADASVFWWK